MFKPAPPHTGLDSLECYREHTKKLSTPQNNQYLKNLRLKTRDNFERTNAKLGNKMTLEIMAHRRAQFNYKAFKNDLKGDYKGISHVV